MRGFVYEARCYVGRAESLATLSVREAREPPENPAVPFAAAVPQVSSGCCTPPGARVVLRGRGEAELLRQGERGALRVPLTSPSHAELLDTAAVWHDFHDRLLAFISRRAPIATPPRTSFKR